MATVTVGDHDLELGGDHLVELRESTDLVGDENLLRERLSEDGYLFIRGFHDPEHVRKARKDVLEHMADEDMLHPDEPIEKGVIHPEYFDDGFMMSSGSWTEYPSLEKLVTGDDTMKFFERFIGTEPLAYDFKWGRAKPTDDFTGFHCDKIFMGRGTDQVYTMWRPIGDCPLEMGPLLLCPGSEENQKLRETYAQMDVDRDCFEAVFSDDPYDIIETFGGPLMTADFEAGDVLIFGQYLMHGSLSNQTDRYRISIDTRYQSLEEPVDGRWVGSEPIGHYNWPSDDETPMAELRDEWGF
jgi:hypothetical protein